MKILFISAFPPNQKTAGQDYTRRLILDLLSHNHEVSLVYAAYPEHKTELPESVQILDVIKPSLFNCLRKPCFHPFYTKRFSRKILKFIQSVACDYDVLYFDFSQVHLYSLFVNHPCKILMCHDVICQKYMRKGKFQLPLIKFSERKTLKSAKAVITFSRKDSGIIKNVYGLDSYSVNFYLKTSRFSYKGIDVEPDTFCFYGAWNRAENLEPLKEFLDKVFKKLPDNIKIKVIGGGLPQSEIDKINSLENISYLGFVENPVTEIAGCQALLAPLKKGAGVKVKVIDALSCGTSVVGTDVAFEGIEDNLQHRLLIPIKDASDIESVLSAWKTVTAEYKQNAADEFFTRYNTNHFPELLKKINFTEYIF